MGYTASIFFFFASHNAQLVNRESRTHQNIYNICVYISVGLSVNVTYAAVPGRRFWHPGLSLLEVHANQIKNEKMFYACFPY